MWTTLHILEDLFLLGFMLLIRPQLGWVSRENALPTYRSTPVKHKHKHKIYQYMLWITAAILAVVGFTIGLVMLFRGVNANDLLSLVSLSKLHSYIKQELFIVDDLLLEV
ncbi:unnamed protein product [Musa textilis]